MEASKLHPSQVFRMGVVSRTELKNAPYNPRFISDAAKKKLKVGLEKLGLLQPLVWNKRSGNLVGGHQRLGALDKLADGAKDYTLEVAVVDLPHAAEVEANILLNNPEVHGDWDLTKLDEALRTEGLRLDATGWDMADVLNVLGESPFAMERSAELEELANAQRQTTEAIDGVMASVTSERDDTDFYVVVVFRNPDERTEFLTKLGLDDNRFQDGRKLQRVLTEGPDPVELPKPHKRTKAAPEGAEAPADDWDADTSSVA
jgi:hypothetical protein